MKRFSILILTAFVAAIAFWLFLQNRAKEQANDLPTIAVTKSGNLVSKPIESPSAKALPVPDFITDSNDARILALPHQKFYEQARIDPNLQWKMPINFWGRVVDESNNVVFGANVHFVWNDLSANGTSDADTKSDGNGFFSLLGRRGKGMTVTVSKDGYYDTSSSRQSFEYAQPESRFIPDPNRPVVFYLRKKHGGAELVSTNAEITLAVGKVISFPLNAQTTLQIELLTNAPMWQKQWATHVSVINGGIQPAIEEFPFEAPPEGYESELELNLDTPKPPAWMNLYQGGEFYIKTANGYGRLELKMISGKNFMEISFLLNPSGSTNLESK